MDRPSFDKFPPGAAPEDPPSTRGGFLPPPPAQESSQRGSYLPPAGPAPRRGSQAPPLPVVTEHPNGPPSLRGSQLPATGRRGSYLPPLAQEPALRSPGAVARASAFPPAPPAYDASSRLPSMHGGQAQGAGPITRRTGLAPAPPVEPAVKRTTYLPPPAAPEAPAPGSTRASYLPQPLAAPRPQTLAVRAAGPAAPAPLAGDTAHELYTPINQILGYARLLMGALRGRVPAQHVEDLLNIERAARTLLGIAEALETGETAEGVPPSSTRISADDMYDATDPMGPAAPVGSLGTLLVVDDSRMNRDVLCRVLGRAGYFTEVAEDGPRALALAARQRFDAVLLDVNMPGMSGLGVLAALRASQTSAELPVIMVTTQGASEDVVEALKLGANDHVIKPIDFDVLLARLDTHLTLKRSRQELAELAAEVSLKNEFIRKTFGRYLSEDVVHRLLTTPEGQRLGGEEREVTILMSDVRSFTTMTEHMPPELVMDLLNGYLGEMARLVAARGGTIIEFIGDAVLAVFGAPFGAGDDARRAVTCALEMQLAMDGVNERNARSGLPQLEIGVALNTGVVVVGNIGGEARTKYGVVGAHVNLTARIEAFSVGRQILISESTRRAAGPGLLIGQSHALAVKGFQDRVLAFELVGLDGPTRVSLPERRAELALLARPLAVECVRLVGKRTDGEPSRGLVIALSPSGAALRLRPRPAPFTNLLLRLPGALGEQLGGELYAKVIELDARVEDTLRVRFTSAPPGLAALVQALREA